MVRVENLEERVKALEQEVNSLRELVARLLPRGIASGVRVQDETNADEEPADADGEMDEYYQALNGEAPGIEKLRAMLVAHGVHPGDEIVRQVIADMRE